MLKFTDTMVTFREIPDEITLCINISNCPIHCIDCHSKELWNDVGEVLTEEKIWSLIERNEGITCFCLMGGDADYGSLKDCVCCVEKYNKSHNTNIKIAVYSGRHNLQELLNLNSDKNWFSKLDYIKVGNYDRRYGSLDKETTNQRLYQVSHDSETFVTNDITYKFWRKQP